MAAFSPSLSLSLSLVLSCCHLCTGLSHPLLSHPTRDPSPHLLLCPAVGERLNVSQYHTDGFSFFLPLWWGSWGVSNNPFSMVVHPPLLWSNHIGHDQKPFFSFSHQHSFHFLAGPHHLFATPSLSCPVLVGERLLPFLTLSSSAPLSSCSNFVLVCQHRKEGGRQEGQTDLRFLLPVLSVPLQAWACPVLFVLYVFYNRERKARVMICLCRTRMCCFTN